MQKSQIIADVWTNARDKYRYIIFNIISSSGRWHAIPMALNRREDKGDMWYLHYSVSILAITTGKYEITARCHGDTFYDNQYLWIGGENDNVVIVVIPSPFQGIIRTMTSGAVRQFMKWFEGNVKTEGYPDSSNSTSNNVEKGTHNLVAYCAGLIASAAFESNIEVDYCDALVKLIHGSQWLMNSSNTRRLLVWSLGSTYLASAFIKRYIIIINLVFHHFKEI